MMAINHPAMVSYFEKKKLSSFFIVSIKQNVIDLVVLLHFLKMLKSYKTNNNRQGDLFVCCLMGTAHYSGSLLIDNPIELFVLVYFSRNVI